MKDMKAINFFKQLCIATALLTAVAGCNDDNTSNLRLDGDTWLESLTLDEYEGVIDNDAMTVVVGVPETYDVSAMTVSAISASAGAETSVRVGDVLNFTYPQSVTVRNGDAYLDYTVSVQHDAASITSFVLNGSYIGVINQTNRTILVRVPTTEDVTNMVPAIGLSEGATVTPASGEAQDFTEPVEYTVTYRTASATYTVTVEQSDAPSAVYVGLATSISELNLEEQEAANWMLQNVANSQYVSFDDVRTGRVDLSECRVMWWHLHIDGGIDNRDRFTSSAPAAIQAVTAVRDFYEAGGSLLLSRYATYYAVDMGATADGNNPNNCWGQVEESGEITGGPWSFYVDDNASHPVFQGVVSSIDGRNGVYTCDAGYRITNSTAQWHIGSDWGGYATLDDWRNLHGGLDLAYGGDGAVVVWEYPENAAGGRIVCIGSGAYDWYSYGVDASADQYHANVATMTQNALNYLSEE